MSKICDSPAARSVTLSETRPNRILPNWKLADLVFAANLSARLLLMQSMLSKFMASFCLSQCMRMITRDVIDASFSLIGEML